MYTGIALSQNLVLHLKEALWSRNVIPEGNYLLFQLRRFICNALADYHNDASQAEKVPESLMKKEGREFFTKNNEKSVWFLIAQLDMMESV